MIYVYPIAPMKSQTQNFQYTYIIQSKNITKSQAICKNKTKQNKLKIYVSATQTQTNKTRLMVRMLVIYKLLVVSSQSD